MVFATNGVITKISDYGNSDKLLSMITPTGRIAVMVKGAKSPTSKLMAISQLFTYGNYEIYEKNNSYWLRGGSVINSFYEITRDISYLPALPLLCKSDTMIQMSPPPSTSLFHLVLRLSPLRQDRTWTYGMRL